MEPPQRALNNMVPLISHNAAASALPTDVDGRPCAADNTTNMKMNRSGWLCVLATSAVLMLAATVASAQSTAAQAEKEAKQALSAESVHGFDPAMTYVGQEAVASPVNGAQHEVLYTISGPGAGVKSSVQYRIYENPAAAMAHAVPDVKQEMDEAAAADAPRGSFRSYHSRLGGSPLAQQVPETFHCRALQGKGSWSRCYYYPGGQSNIVVVGTTTSTQANEAILLTAMGAEGLAAAKP